MRRDEHSKKYPITWGRGLAVDAAPESMSADGFSSNTPCIDFPKWVYDLPEKDFRELVDRVALELKEKL